MKIWIQKEIKNELNENQRKKMIEKVRNLLYKGEKKKLEGKKEKSKEGEEEGEKEGEEEG